MSTMSLVGHGPHHKPKQTFLPVGALIAVMVFAGLAFLLWYGCSWLTNSEQLWQDARNADQASPSATIAAAEASQSSGLNITGRHK